MNVESKYLPHYTVSDWEHWEGRWELIGGIPYAMSPIASPKHQRVNARVTTELQLKLKSCDECVVYPPIDWKIDEETVIQPDASVVCGEWEGHYLTFPPVLVFEILSPSTALKDRNLKYRMYEEKGVLFYVIVDMDKKVAEVYELEGKQYQKKGEYAEENFIFKWDTCTLDFNFSNIW